MQNQHRPAAQKALGKLSCFFLLATMTVLSTSCSLEGGSIPAQDAGVSATPVMDDPAASAIEVYFTDPESPSAHDQRGGVDEILAAAIDQAQHSVDMAMYNLSLVSITDALLRAKARGVMVRVVMESDALDGEQPQRLSDAGIVIVSDQREELMHNKFLVIDGIDVWTGSLNMTKSGVYEDNNNLIRIHSDKMAADYSLEFNEMFVDRLFGANSPVNTLYPQFDLDGDLVEVYFSPEDGAAQHILDVIRNAHEQIDFMTYSFTSNEIGRAMIDRAGSGVRVRGVFEESQAESNYGSEFERLKDAGLEIRKDGNAGLMHHKVIIVDREVVVTGSYNFTASAENRNDENSLIIHSHDLAEQYLAEFEKVFAQGY